MKFFSFQVADGKFIAFRIQALTQVSEKGEPITDNFTFFISEAELDSLIRNSLDALSALKSKELKLK